MNLDDIQGSAAQSINSLKESGTQCCQSLEEKIRESPIPAISIAALVGFIFPLRSVFALLGALVGIAFKLLRPALLVLAIFKVAEMARAKTGTASDLGMPPTGL